MKKLIAVCFLMNTNLYAATATQSADTTPPPYSPMSEVAGMASTNPDGSDNIPDPRAYVPGIPGDPSKPPIPGPDNQESASTLTGAQIDGPAESTMQPVEN